MEKMKIEIWSDIACPYCYIGKRKLEEALNNFPHSDEIELVWHSYELNPSLPKASLDKSMYEYMAKQHGKTVEAEMSNIQNIIDKAKAVGLTYNFDKLVVTNTSDALRLIKLAKNFKLATEAEEVLFKAYFTDGKCISDKQTLIDLGSSIGLPKEEIIKLLNGDEYLSEINKDIRYSEDKLDLEYIPFYLFNNSEIIQGSIESDDYLKALTKSYDFWKKNGVAKKTGDRINGDACSIDGVCTI